MPLSKSEQLDRTLVEEIRGTIGSGRVLDLPAGDCNLSKQLAETGFQVTPSDLFPEVCDWDRSEVVQADMNSTLPFEDDCFDGIVSQEGVEHLENLASFFRECRRILKPGGYLWITTPNFMDLSSRFSQFLSGMKSFRAGFPNEETTVWSSSDKRLYHGHAFALPFFQIRYLLRLAQFDDIRLRGFNRSGTSVLLYPFLRLASGPLISLAQRRHRSQDKRRAASENLYTELRGHALSSELLLHKKIMVRAKLAEGSFEAPEANGSSSS